MEFKKIQLNGFKSFAEKTDFRYLDRYPPRRSRRNEPITDLSSSPPQETGEVVGVSTKIFTDHSKLLLGQNY